MLSSDTSSWEALTFPDFWSEIMIFFSTISTKITIHLRDVALLDIFSPFNEVIFNILYVCVNFSNICFAWAAGKPTFWDKKMIISFFYHNKCLCCRITLDSVSYVVGGPH